MSRLLTELLEVTLPSPHDRFANEDVRGKQSRCQHGFDVVEVISQRLKLFQGIVESFDPKSSNCVFERGP